MNTFEFLYHLFEISRLSRGEVVTDFYSVPLQTLFPGFFLSWCLSGSPPSLPNRHLPSSYFLATIPSTDSSGQVLPWGLQTGLRAPIESAALWLARVHNLERYSFSCSRLSASCPMGSKANCSRTRFVWSSECQYVLRSTLQKMGTWTSLNDR